MNIKLSAVALFAASLSLLSPAGAQTPAVSFTGGSAAVVANQGTVGFRFTLTSSLDVSALGLWDENSDGLSHSHMMGIFNASGALVAVANIPAGNTATLLDGFRYVFILPITLPPGTYNIGAFYSTMDADRVLIFATGFSTNSHLQYDGSAYISGASLANPIGSGGGEPSAFGPNFLAVPEGTMLLIALGAVGLFAFRRVAGMSSSSAR